MTSADRELTRLEHALEGVEAPFALVDLDAMWANGEEMLVRAQGKPIRVASKSVRARRLLEAMLARDERFRGLMTFTLPETLWLAEAGFEDLLLAYPSADRTALARLARLEGEARPTVMIDRVAHLDLIDSAAVERAAPIRVCIEVDAGFWLAGGRLKIGPKRSPVRTPEAAAALARAIVERPGFEIAGLMAYEGHIAGLGDRPASKRLRGAAIGAMQRSSGRELRERRAAIVDAVTQVAPLGFVNGGGTGSLHTTSAESAVTEVTAGSGFYAPALFDDYSAFSLRPAAMFAAPVVRKPESGVATLLGCGYPASGPAQRDRLPRPHLPAGLRLDPFEGAGEVQTPVRGRAAAGLEIGDRVYLRHAKAGELCERFDTLYLVQGDAIVDEVPTYRGEGRCFL